MSKHWRPEDTIITGPWTPPAKRAPLPAIALLVGAVAVGALGGMALQHWQPRVTEAPPAAAAIEWDAVQAVPRRAPDAADLEWERRAAGLDAPAPPAASTAGEQAVRASFGFCHTGGGTNCVVDGDTFYINGAKVRIAGIDAPETHPPRCAEESRLGNEATAKLRALLNSGAVTLSGIDRDRDRYGRLLRNVSVGGSDVGEAMIAAGVAREYGSGRRPWC